MRGVDLGSCVRAGLSSAITSNMFPGLLRLEVLAP